MRCLITTIILLLLMTGMLPAQTASTEPPDWNAFAAQLKPLTENWSIQADYRQTRHLQSISFTFVIHGRMLQEPGRRLAWITTTPLHTVTIFTAKSFQQWDAETKQVTSISTADMPWLKMIFDYQSQWLSGNLEIMRQDFTMVPLDWQTLRLIPKQEAFTIFFQEIELRFRKDFAAIEKITFKERNGDFMVMDFTKVINNEPIPKETWNLPPK